MPVTRKIKLTQFSHGAGCGCKISPKILEVILRTNSPAKIFPHLLVGYESNDDAAVYDIGNGESVISTTDFFMPIVDDPFDFGRIAAVNAISDVYAMGGTPLIAISVLGWPINKIDPSVAGKVIEGGRFACMEAGIPLAGGHSIDSPEPIFGLAVTGKILNKNIKRNNTAKEGCLLYLTKPLGIGILTTAQKKGLLEPEHSDLAKNIMVQLNKIGEKFGEIKGISAMTDVTGFGLLGHLCEMAEGSGLSAEIFFDTVPKITGIDEYIEKNCIPGGTNRNWESYGHKIVGVDDFKKNILADPQTSGGLLIAVEKSAEQSVLATAMTMKVEIVKIGKMIKKENQCTIRVE